MRIKGSRINFGTHSIYKHPQGIYIDGEFKATGLVAQSHAQGDLRGYASGRLTPSAFNDSIETFPFASDTNATEYGNLSVIREESAGQSSTTHGYTSGGYTTPLTNFNVIDKFPFAGVTGSASDVGNLTAARLDIAGQSSTTSGYVSGGRSLGPGGVPTFNTIDKFPFVVDSNASDVGDLTQSRRGVAGQSSSTHGYTSGGYTPPAAVNTIDKFPFAADTNATDVGDLTQARNIAAGQSSGDSGYLSGGITPTPEWVATIDKFTFVSDVTATDVGVLTQARGEAAGQSSTTHGYTSGGRASPFFNTIDKFPFSADAAATDVGDLNEAKNDITGQQV